MSDVRRQAPKSVEGVIGMVDVRGVGRVWAEPPDTDDTFPPAIAEWEYRDGWVFYKGRRGEHGVIVGTADELVRWIRDVERQTDASPSGEPRRWTPEDGGEEHVRAARKTAERTARIFGIPAPQVKVFVADRMPPQGDFVGNTVHLYNVHKGGTTELGGSNVPLSEQIAAHEVAHAVYAKNRSAAEAVTEILAERERLGEPYVSVYHSMSSHFEGTMEAVSWYVIDTASMRRKTPELWLAVDRWAEGRRANRRLQSDQRWLYSPRRPTKRSASHASATYRYSRNPRRVGYPRRVSGRLCLAVGSDPSGRRKRCLESTCRWRKFRENRSNRPQYCRRVAKRAALSRPPHLENHGKRRTRPLNRRRVQSSPPSIGEGRVKNKNWYVFMFQEDDSPHNLPHVHVVGEGDNPSQHAKTFRFAFDENRLWVLDEDDKEKENFRGGVWKRLKRRLKDHVDTLNENWRILNDLDSDEDLIVFTF